MISISRKGALYALLAYGSWGVFPLYWKNFGGISPVEVIAHRLLWSCVFLVALAFATGQGRECARILRAPRLLAWLFLTAVLLSANWGLFVYGVNTGRVVETSLGYFLNPLFTVLLGVVGLREHLSRAQAVAVGLAAAGVIAFGLHVGRVPWIALGIAFSFGLYGFFRKIIRVDPLPGLLIETLLMLPVALIVVGGLVAHHASHFLDSPPMTLFFLSTGIITVFPLIWFISAARLLPLSMLGFLQYLSPTLQLLVGVVIYHEPFSHREAIAFVLIWLAIAVYLATVLRRKPDPMIPE